MTPCKHVIQMRRRMISFPASLVSAPFQGKLGGMFRAVGLTVENSRRVSVSTHTLLQSLERQIENLAQEIEPIGHAPAQQARFDVTLFASKGTRLREYLAEVRTNFAQLRQVVAENRSAQVAFVAERLVSQITALQRELATQTLRQADKQTEAKSSDYYSKLVEHQQYERRLIAMIEDRESRLGRVETFKEQQVIQKELAALEGRLMRCRQALIKIERSIERQERGF